MRVGPGVPPCPALSSLLIFSCSVCFFSFVFLVLFSFCLAVKICTFTLQIVNSKNCILNFYMREEEPTSIYIYINISLYIYIQIYIKQMVCHLVAFLWLKALFLSSFWEADGIKAQELPFMPLDALCCGARIPVPVLVPVPAPAWAVWEPEVLPRFSRGSQQGVCVCVFESRSVAPLPKSWAGLRD